MRESSPISTSPHTSEIEAGLINLTLDNVQALAVAFGMERSDLLKPTV